MGAVECTAWKVGFSSESGVQVNDGSGEVVGSTGNDQEMLGIVMLFQFLAVLQA